MKYLKIFELNENEKQWKSDLLDLSDYFLEIQESGVECDYRVGYKSQRNERIYFKLSLGEDEMMTGIDGGSPQSIADDMRELESYLRIGNQLVLSVDMYLPYDSQNDTEPYCGVKTLEKFSEILRVYNSAKKKMPGYKSIVNIVSMRRIEILFYKL